MRIVCIRENEMIVKLNKFVVDYCNKNVSERIDGSVGLRLDGEDLN